MSVLRSSSSILLLSHSKSRLTHLLALPPHLRTRAFSSTPRPQNILLSTITASHDALTAVHSLTGLPWAYSIPLFAVMLRTTLVLPLAIYTRRSLITKVQISPILQAYKTILIRQTMRENLHFGPVKVQGEVLRKVKAKREELYKRYGCGNWKTYLGLLQLPIFLSVMEALRKMCASNQGVLGMLLGSDETVVQNAETGAESTLASLSPDSGTFESLLSSIPLESSFATEGMLWFPDLLLPDPYYVLPFVLSGTILLSIFGGSTSHAVIVTTWQKRVKSSMGTVALCIGPLMLNVPSALMIYWITSSTTAYLQALLLDKFMPLPKPIPTLEPKGRWMVALGQKPDGYVNPLLTMKDGEALFEKGSIQVENGIVGRGSKPVVVEDNKPVGKAGSMSGV
ncbi:related to COX18 Protein required for activity of mitochondrial cytochrome oxidase [Rhynchosporium agropyri]|uniref:Related to COX18 Protein required for activity of mitochondrial cytochrome oxidase n=1 Tax=Rhynchosporium agropyri TaxID=914238 RepID=A0A1E1LPM9_9HELO|nr:related to COX18 Protein required for activity of mitochondrial cytochrome oxidase [Rhynchosporium agropyri]